MGRKCSWCNKYIGDNDRVWTKKVIENGKEYISNEIFCSPQCQYQYPYKPTPNKSNSTGCLVLIAIAIIIFFLSQ